MLSLREEAILIAECLDMLADRLTIALKDLANGQKEEATKTVRAVAKDLRILAERLRTVALNRRSAPC